MADNGDSLVTAVVIATAAALFVRPMYEAATGVELSASQYPGLTGLVLSQLPVLAALFAVVAAGVYITRNS